MILEKLQKVNSTLLDSVNATSNKHAAETFSIQLGMLNNSTTQLEQLLNLMAVIHIIRKDTATDQNHSDQYADYGLIMGLLSFLFRRFFLFFHFLTPIFLFFQSCHPLYFDRKRLRLTGNCFLPSKSTLSLS